MTKLLPNSPVLLQACLAVVILGVTALMPPQNGAMLIVSLDGQSRGQIARWAIERHALLIGPGPWGHSLVVSGERGRLIGAALSHHALVLTGSFAGCGKVVQL